MGLLHPHHPQQWRTGASSDHGLSNMTTWLHIAIVALFNMMTARAQATRMCTTVWTQTASLCVQDLIAFDQNKLIVHLTARLRQLHLLAILRMPAQMHAWIRYEMPSSCPWTRRPHRAPLRASVQLCCSCYWPPAATAITYLLRQPLSGGAHVSKV